MNVLIQDSLAFMCITVCCSSVVFDVFLPVMDVQVLVEIKKTPQRVIDHLTLEDFEIYPVGKEIPKAHQTTDTSIFLHFLHCKYII